MITILASQALVYLQRGWEQSPWLRRSSIKMALVRLVNNNNNNYTIGNIEGWLNFFTLDWKDFQVRIEWKKYFDTRVALCKSWKLGQDSCCLLTKYFGPEIFHTTYLWTAGWNDKIVDLHRLFVLTLLKRKKQLISKHTSSHYEGFQNYILHALFMPCYTAIRPFCNRAAAVRRKIRFRTHIITM